MDELKKIYLGEREQFYSVFLEYEDFFSEILHPKDLGKLECYVCGLRDGLSAEWGEIPVLNGCPHENQVDPMKENEFRRIMEYIADWDGFRLANSLAPD